MNDTLVELKPAEALLFIEFQKRHSFFALLESIQAFEIRNGSITVNFDSVGAISSVTKNQVFRP